MISAETRRSINTVVACLKSSALFIKRKLDENFELLKQSQSFSTVDDELGARHGP